jgi:hypothetical protein
MGEVCDDLLQKIHQFRRALAQQTDSLTTERLTAAVVKMEARKFELHAEHKA